LTAYFLFSLYRLSLPLSIMEEIDDIMKIENKPSREKKLKDLKDKAYKYSLSTVCEKKELEFPLFSRSFNWIEIIKTTFSKFS